MLEPFNTPNPQFSALQSQQQQPSQLPPLENEERVRFQTELEFVQALANPHYIHYLAQRDYFKEKFFVNYLKYLLYWTRPEYVVYIKYPHCLHHLHLLQHAAFREAMKSASTVQMVDDQQLLQWQFDARKRIACMQVERGEENTDTNNATTIEPQPER